MATTPDAAPPSVLSTAFSGGFRPFFLGAALWAAGSMALWIAMLAGLADP
ncbi:MAG: NnrS family protein, partial [Pseudomonadota bacterium]